MSLTPSDDSAVDQQSGQKAIDSGLYIVATPIGNLADMSQRAVELLRAAELVAVEDSRVTGKLLHHLGLKKRMVRYNDHSSEGDRERLLAGCAKWRGGAGVGRWNAVDFRPWV